MIGCARQYRLCCLLRHHHGGDHRLPFRVDADPYQLAWPSLARAADGTALLHNAAGWRLGLVDPIRS